MSHAAKKAFTYSLFVAMLLAIAACKEEPEPRSASSGSVPAATDLTGDQPLVAEPGASLLTVGVDGMHCVSCAQSIAKNLQKLDGVRKVRVSFEKKAAWVLVDEKVGPDVPKIVQTVIAAGYKAQPAGQPTTQPATVPAKS